MKNLIQLLVLFLSLAFFSACTEYYYDVENGSRITELEDKLEDLTSTNGSRITELEDRTSTNGSRITELEDRLDDRTSTNGSRIIFREFLLEDGSVYRDNRPFDTLYNRVCQIEEDDIDRYSDNGVDVYIGILNGCCTSFDSIDPVFLEYYPDGKLYSDSECTTPLETNYTLHKSMIDLKEGSFFKKTMKKFHEDFFGTVIQRVEKILSDTEVYRKVGEDCRLSTYETPVIIKELTIEETRALFVCKAETEEG